MFGVMGLSLLADIFAGDLVSSIVVFVLFVVVVALMAGKRFVYHLAWLVPVMLLLYDAGSYLHFFNTVNNFDKVVHTYSAFLVTYIAAVVYQKMLELVRKKHAVWYILAIASFGLAIGALWEIFEYFIQFVVHQHLNLGVFDTITDLIADCVGAGIGSLISYYSLKNHKS